MERLSSGTGAEAMDAGESLGWPGPATQRQRPQPGAETIDGRRELRPAEASGFE
ncbi:MULTISPECIES: hypothetical protein [unclassified Paenibacillus]|uniref:hypothetical protein n=1 Tax=unclassified Paenibacillus TaxID=185978 RepID=UPI0012FE2CE2|nr:MULTISPECIES: hypothetical protein [unclassified Paenibacillus]QID16108.1 hypothetical protein CIC07_25635 [Paenibacillus sp. RUD330]